MRAFKLSKRAARVGFDFERAADSADKVAEELAEVREAASAATNTIDTPADATAATMNRAAPAVSAETGPAPAPLSATPRSVAELRIFEEVGDLLFAAANLARKLEVDPEAALRAANLKFERRFHGMERLAAQRGENFERLNLVAQEALWQAVKRAE
jgi:ATP diphosphatase